MAISFALFSIVIYSISMISRREHDKSGDEAKYITAIPLGLLCGCVTAYASDVFFRGEIRDLLTIPPKYGFTFMGWLIGCMVYFRIHSWICRISYLELLNLYLPVFALAQAIGRIGCFCGGCCYGKPVKWGVIYPAGSYPDQCYHGVALHPVQLYESVYLFIVFILLLKAVPFPYRAGVYLISISCGRFFFEYFRGDPRGDIFRNSPFSPAQLLAISLFVFGVLLVYYQNRRQKNNLGDSRQKL
jgi:phosphatidylglycerol:prolipoprotein diacylglycerol transferase